MGQKLISELFWELVKKELAGIDEKYIEVLGRNKTSLFIATNDNVKAGMDFSTAVKMAACKVAGSFELKEEE